MVCIINPVLCGVIRSDPGMKEGCERRARYWSIMSSINCTSIGQVNGGIGGRRGVIWLVLIIMMVTKGITDDIVSFSAYVFPFFPVQSIFRLVQ